MRRATTYSRTWSALALLTIGAASLVALRARPGPHPGSFPPIPTAGALRTGEHRLGALRSASSTRLLSQAPSPAMQARLERSYGKLPLTFIANRGQLDRRVAYYVPGRDKSLYFTSHGVTFALAGRTGDQRRTTNAADGRPVAMPASFTRGSRLSAPNPK